MVEPFLLEKQEYYAPANTPHFLVIDDDEVDVTRCCRLLKQAFGKSSKIDAVTTWSDAVNTIDSEYHDVYIVDQNLGVHTGLELVETFRGKKKDCVFILLTGQDDRAIDLAATKAGASDYLLKSDLSPTRLERSIRYALSMNTKNLKLRRLAAELEHAQRELEKTLNRAKESETKYRYLAQHDVLTGLPNRMLFSDRLSVAMMDAKRHPTTTALLLCDLDKFKQINDTYGHQTGDFLLKEVAGRLSSCVRNSDTVARLGGDEFAALLTHTRERHDAASVADKMVKAMEEPFTYGGQRFSSGLSIGISLVEHGIEEPDELLHQADMALYCAKQNGRRQYQFFDDALNEEAKRISFLKRELACILDGKHLYLVYQPKLNLRTGQLCGLEALARWCHQSLGQVSPSEFIPLAENSGQIAQMSERILKEAVGAIRQLKACLGYTIPVSVNLSAVQLKQSGLKSHIKSLLEDHNVEPSSLELEITETSAVENFGTASKLLHDVRTMGTKIAIDDFGTGYSSLAVATNLPADQIKIDQSFVSGMLTRSADAAAVSATISLAKSLNMTVVAEGVETSRQLDFLKASGCDSAQGYFIGKPMKLDSLKSFFEDWPDWYNRYGSSTTFQ